MKEREKYEREKLISVIIPVYKVEKYLKRCIDSVINQTYEKLEIILIDDGSPDNCGNICDYYSKIDDRIIVHHQKKFRCIWSKK
ncbi:glycosyltransferase family 2 protein [Clostridium perfringens]|nr:glycosyltransferase family 2 protein [Clostridium perfringens]